MSRIARRRRLFATTGLAALLTVVTGCTPRPQPSSKGYTGTWSKGNERVKSIFYIIDNDEGTWFRWRRWTADDKLRVDCDWSGYCEGFSEGKRYAEYHFKSWKDPESGNLMVECRETIFDPREAEISYRDELVLEDDGQTLVSYTVEQMGEVFEPGKRPSRRFEKVSDAVPSPPEEARLE